MKYVRKLFWLAYRAVRKISYLIRERFDLIEVKILSIGLVMILLLGLYLLYLLFADAKRYGVLSSTAIGPSTFGSAGCSACAVASEANNAAGMKLSNCRMDRSPEIVAVLPALVLTRRPNIW